MRGGKGGGGFLKRDTGLGPSSVFSSLKFLSVKKTITAYEQEEK